MKQQFGLDLVLSQQLKLTPSVVLSLQLLQLPVVSLEEFLRNEVETNPLIEREEEEELPSVSSTQEESFDFVFEGGNVFLPEETEEFTPPSRDTVYDRLKSQVLAEFDGVEREVALYILENLDRSGFLPASDEEIATSLGVPVETVERVRERFKRLSPVGCGSRSLSEALQVQLEEMGAPRKLIESLSYLGYISSPSTFKAKAGLTDREFEELLAYLRRCDTRPGEDGEFGVPVKPDARVWLENGEVKVEVVQPSWLNFRINSYYLKHASREELKKFIKEKYQRALWLKKAIDQRRETLEKVLRELFKRQKEFLKDGKTLKTVTLSEIASALSLHESTVSRALKDKFIETPFGVFPSKFFFKGASENSQKSLKEAIREIIESEDKRKPYSDSKIAQLLKERGFKVARRTVAKYREEMGIPGAFKRRVR